jgi:hypothetical protein
MATFRGNLSALVLVLICTASTSAFQQAQASDGEFGPVVRAYLGYLRNEQEVVDDRASRHEVSTSYYRRNSNRIRALRQIAVRLARDSHNDYLPELEAVATDELNVLFGSNPPQLARLKAGEVVRNTFKFLGVVKFGENFYIFSRLDPYEQADLKANADTQNQTDVKSLSRGRRVGP